MASQTSTEPQYHPVADRVLYVGNVPLDTTGAELAACFDICLGKDSVAFLHYPYDSEAKCHKGFAFVMLNRGSDVAICMSKKYRSWFYVEGAPSRGGFDSRGRAYLRIRSAHIPECLKKEESTHLVFAPKSASSDRLNASIHMRDFKALVEDLTHTLGVKIVKCDAVLEDRFMKMDSMTVHLHTVDAESAAVVKMLIDNFKENDVIVKVQHARKPKVAKAAAEAVKPSAQESVVPQASKKLVIEPITENYGRFGIPYSEVVKSSAVAAPSASAAPSAASTSARSSASVVTKATPIGRHANRSKAPQVAAKSTKVAGTA